MKLNILSFVILFLLGSGCVVVSYLLIKSQLKKVLDDLIRLPAATALFDRILLLTLSFSALSSIFEIPFNLKSDAASMEYVWKIGDGLAKVFTGQLLISLAFILLITIVIAVHKKK